jgi:hypothetical protein
MVLVSVTAGRGSLQSIVTGITSAVRSLMLWFEMALIRLMSAATSACESARF